MFVTAWLLYDLEELKFMNIFEQAMETAGKKFIGEHDFRNFCKMDAANVHNYKRNITSFEIFPCDERFAAVILNLSNYYFSYSLVNLPFACSSR